ncbi:MAG: di-heme oxidoredictase family protein [Kiloniellaceae bacterium]
MSESEVRALRPPARGALARARNLGALPRFAWLWLTLATAACGGEAEFVSALLPDFSEPPEAAAPAVYPDPSATAYASAAYGSYSSSQYDNGDEIVNGKCLPDHPVSYCTTIDGLFKQPVGFPVYEARARFLEGNRVFNANWVPAPRPYNELRDGLGPVFDARSCAACHANNGRGRPLSGRGEGPESMIVRIGLKGAPAGAAPLPHPRYGGQFNTRAVPGARPEGRVVVSYEEIEGRFADGQAFSVRQPRYGFADLAYGPLGEGALISPRIAPPVIGLGLVEAVPAEAIVARADPGDTDGDGISGRANFVPDPADGQVKLGRFGWKAGAVSLRHQSAAALSGDMGITSSLLPEANCPAVQKACLAGPSGGRPEIRDRDFDDLVFYMQMLSPTGRRAVQDPDVVRGEALFEVAGCAACHVPRMTTGVHPEAPALSHLVFHPYSDFLLHDMGEGLADGRPEYQASGREWRTPPLWGIGLSGRINGNTYYLHDGRARSLMEAVLWHGGEAEISREAVLAMPKLERAALVAFLESL